MKRYLASAGSALALVASGALALAACRLETPPLADEKTAEAPAGCGDGPGRFCGGFGGIQCPPGLVCEDDPSDDCDPDRGGADCGGICVPGDGDGDDDCDSPGRRYVSHDPGMCQVIFFTCARGLTPFIDGCGCGCEPSRSGGIPCGDNACRQGQFCCNPSCGICAPIGGSCILIDCD